MICPRCADAHIELMATSPVEAAHEKRESVSR